MRDTMDLQSDLYSEWALVLRVCVCVCVVRRSTTRKRRPSSQRRSFAMAWVLAFELVMLHLHNNIIHSQISRVIDASYYNGQATL